MDAAGTPNRGLTCLKGRYHFRGGAAEPLAAGSRPTEPSAGTAPIDWAEAVERFSEVLKGKPAFFLSASLTDQEIAAVKSALHDGCVVAAKGFSGGSDSAAKISELAASFDIETPKGKVRPDAAGLVQKMTLLAKAAEFGQDVSAFPENLRELYALGANARGLLDAVIVTHTPEEAVKAVKTGKADAAVFIDCAPGDFGLAEADMKGVKKISIASEAIPNSGGGAFDLCLPITAWEEREGTCTGAFSGARLAVHRGPLPPEGARSLRWVLAEALRRTGIEIASAEMSEMAM
jgi:hypothetical protein